MSLPDRSKLESIYSAGKKDPSLGFRFGGQGWAWSSSERNALYVYGMRFDNGYVGDYAPKHNGPYDVLCVGD